MTEAECKQQEGANVGRRRLIVLAPLSVFLGLVALFLIRLYSGDPSRIPSALIGHPAPQTTLPPVAGLDRNGEPVPGIDPARFKGAVTVMNVWASWCVPCHDEAPLLDAARARQPAARHRHQLQGRAGECPALSRPLRRSVRRRRRRPNGRAAIEWGVYGVPETFIVGRDARIAYKLVGPITPDNLDTVLKPEIEKAFAAGS